MCEVPVVKIIWRVVMCEEPAISDIFAYIQNL